MAEWSKALDSSSSLFGGVGSNPTSTMLFFLPAFVRLLRQQVAITVRTQSRLAQLVERKTFNLVVVGSSPTVGAFLFLQIFASGDLTARPLGAFRKICSCKFRSCSSTLFSFLVKEIIFVLQADKSLRCMIMSSYEGDLWHF